MKSYINNNSALASDLEETLAKHGKLIIGLDFDNTLRSSDDISLDTQKVIDLAQDCSLFGFDMCLWTIITGEGLDLREKVKWCQDRAINIQYANSSPIDNDSRFKGNRKPYFNVLLDDKAGLDSAYHALKHAIRHLYV